MPRIIKETVGGVQYALVSGFSIENPGIVITRLGYYTIKDGDLLCNDAICASNLAVGLRGPSVCAKNSSLLQITDIQYGGPEPTSTVEKGQPKEIYPKEIPQATIVSEKYVLVGKGEERPETRANAEKQGAREILEEVKETSEKKQGEVWSTISKISDIVTIIALLMRFLG